MEIKLDNSKEFPVINSKSLLPIIYSWVIIFITIYIGKIFIFLYPLCLIVLCNRIIALGLLTHEGIHGNLSTSKSINLFLAKYLCAFPVYISFEKWRQFHLYHHRFLGTELDNDKYLYSYFPKKIGPFLFDLISGKLVFYHFSYFTDITKIFNLNNNFQKKLNPMLTKRDTFSFILFHSSIFITLYFLNGWSTFLLFWIIPFFLCIPITLLFNCIQHYEVINNEKDIQKSRTIVTRNLWTRILLPLNVQFHAEHHLAPSIPQYHLPAFSTNEAIEKQSQLNYEDSLSILKKLLINLF